MEGKGAKTMDGETRTRLIAATAEVLASGSGHRLSETGTTALAL
jgi:hypothetical protein